MVTEKFTVVVLGAGRIGGTIGRKWVSAGHHVTFGVTDLNGKNAQALRSELGDKITIDHVPGALQSEPDVILMALPGAAMEETITTYAAQLDGKTIIDAANRMGGGIMNSFATFQAHTPSANIYRAFNTLGWENFADPVFDGVPADLFFAGPAGSSRAMIEQLIADIGLRPVWLGGVEHIGLVDAISAIWFTLALQQKKGRNLAFKVLTR